MDKLTSTNKMFRTLLACAFLFLWTAVGCDADAYSVDRGRIVDDDDAGKRYFSPTVLGK